MKGLASLLALGVAAALSASALAAEPTDKAKEWCTDAHMQLMDEMVGKMTDASKKKTAAKQLDKSKAAMKKGDMKGCVSHMEKAHKAMGM
jgi:nucleoside-specific outer membrane channel protein Tsx